MPTMELDFDDATWQEVDALALALRVPGEVPPTRAAVVLRALGLLRFVVTERCRGGRVYVEHRGARVRPEITRP